MELAEFPCRSVAVQVTIVSPIGKSSGASFTIESKPITSVADASPSKIVMPSGPVASAVIFSGTRISGEVVSTIVIT